LNSKTQNIVAYSLVALTLVGVAFVILRSRRKSKGVIVKGEYSVPENIPNRVDALHSFESRKSDGFGGKMATKIKEEMMKFYKKGINPDVSDVKIDIDSVNYKVNWSARVHESKDGKAYIGFTTFGSAGSDADKRAIGQFEGVKQRVGGEDYKLVLDFKNPPKGIYIRQFFYKYTKPNEYKPNK
jgi:hypothetical protein